MACYATLMHERSDSMIETNLEDLENFDEMTEEPVISADHNHAYLCVGNIKEAGLVHLVEADMGYWHALRVMMLRGVQYSLRTTVAGSAAQVIYQHSVAQAQITHLHEFLAKNEWDEFEEAIDYVLQVWESEQKGKSMFPKALQTNLESLGQVVGLTPVEKEVLGLTVLIQTEERLSVAQRVFGAGLSYHQVARLFAAVLCRTVQEVQQALSPSGTLARSHLLMVDPIGTGELFSRLDLIDFHFGQRMLQPQRVVLDALEGLIAPVAAPVLTERDFTYMQSRFDSLFEILDRSTKARREGVNVLLYGFPGTGKSQLASVLAQKLKRQLIEVSTRNVVGMPHSPMGRFKCYQLAQAMLDPDHALIVFDECEEVLGQGGMFTVDPEQLVRAQKSWINEQLVNNKVPTIWICNSVADFDPAFIRRFAVCLKVESPSGQYRKEMFQQLCDETVSPQLIEQLVKNEHATPALVSQMAGWVNFVACSRSEQERDQMGLELINDKLKALVQKEVRSARAGACTALQNFRPEMVNSSVDLSVAVNGLKTHRQGRLCLYGAPGTGKTAFGKWVAGELGMPHHVVRGSNLLGKFVGENEQNIAHAFETATRMGAVLQLDEVDTFLSDRATSESSWSASMVNEMLTQMESFEGIFIASTNLYERLDEAALRRFDLAIEFRFMRSEDAVSMLGEVCQSLELDEPTDLQIQTVRRAKNLTPGDFQQVFGQARFIKFDCAQALTDRIMQLNALKKHSASEKMGFLRTA